MQNIFWISDGIAKTGFSTVAMNIIKNMPKDRYDVHHLAINYYGDPHTYDWKIYPAAIKNDLLGFNRVKDFLQAPLDGIFILNDVWVIDRYLKLIEEFYGENPPPPIIVYFPIDSMFLDPEWFSRFHLVKKAFTYTNFGKNEIDRLNLKELDVGIIPHGVDLKSFYKIDKLSAREVVFKENFEEFKDAFVVLNANRNQPRKRIDLTIEGFSRFVKNKPNDNIKLYLHMGIKDVGWDIVKLSARLGVDERLILSGSNIGSPNISEEVLNLIYNSADVGINTCYLPGTKVLTENGSKNIEEIAPGEKVFSHLGILRDVKKTFKFSKNDEEVLKITPYGILPLTLTKNHKLYSILPPYLRLNRKYKKILLENLEPDFIESKYLMEGSLLTFPIIKDEKISIGTKTAFIYGAFLAEGSTNKSGLVFSLDSRIYDDELRNEIISCMKEVYSLEPHISNMDRNRQNIYFYSSKLSKEFREKLGPNAHNKKLPNELLFMKRDEKLALLRGAILGDGSFDHTTISYTTVSEELALQIWFILTTLGGIAPSINKRSRGEFVVRVYGNSSINLAKECNIINKSKKLVQEKKQQRPKIIVTEDFLYYPIRKIEKINYTGLVYDLEVDGEHSYVSHVSGHNSVGEGWGLVNHEHAVTGAPQIVPAHSALLELYRDNGILIPIDKWVFNKDPLTLGGEVRAEDVAIALESIYQNRDTLYNRLSEKTLNKFAAPEYDWKNIVEKYWLPAFEEIWK